MLKFKLTEETEHSYTYRYFPDGEGNGGEVVVSKINGEVISYNLAENDEDKYFFRHFAHRLRKCAETMEFPESGMVAWY